MADTTATEKKVTLQDAFKNRETESQTGINKIYDSGLNAQKQGLLDAYNQNAQAQTNQQQDVQNAFKQANYDIGVQNDRNEANVTQFADVRDVNTGLGSQHRLNLNNARANASSKVAFAQQQAMQESQRQAALLETNYKNQVAAALADNDYKRAAALMDDYNNQNKWREQQAQILASFGEFSPYKDIYGDATAGTMQTMWNMQNPEIAYQLGRISAGKYKDIRGHYPWEGGGGGGYGRWSGGGYYSPSSNPDEPTAKWDGVTAGDIGWGNTAKMLGLTDQSTRITSSSAAKNAQNARQQATNKARGSNAATNTAASAQASRAAAIAKSQK